MTESQSGRNTLYVQAGGVTAVINASAYGVVEALRNSRNRGNLLAGLDGLNGVLEENLIDVTQESEAALQALRHTPAGAFGSCRSDLQDTVKHRAAFQRILDVCAAHRVGTFLYNGGNGSMTTAAKLAQFAMSEGSSLRVIGIPKSIDNDLAVTDNSPGYGSVAKYNAISMMEASLDTASMSHDSTKVFVLETMGRNTGWIAAATGLASRNDEEGPQLILLPEVPLNAAAFLQAVEKCVAQHGHCAVTVSEGLQDTQGRLVAEVHGAGSSGYTQLGGAGHYIQGLVQKELKVKVHGAVLDYCQRSARHSASRTDVEQAIACGTESVALAAKGMSGVMVTVQRTSRHPYRWGVGHTDALNIANQEKIVSPDMIREDGFHITQRFRDYCLPLIQGEDPPPYDIGLPVYRSLKRTLVPKRLPAYNP